MGNIEQFNLYSMEERYTLNPRGGEVCDAPENRNCCSCCSSRRGIEPDRSVPDIGDRGEKGVADPEDRGLQEAADAVEMVGEWRKVGPLFPVPAPDRRGNIDEGDGTLRRNVEDTLPRDSNPA